MERYPLQTRAAGCLKPETGEKIYGVDPCPAGYEPFFTVDVPGSLPACGPLCLFLAVLAIAAAFGD